MTTSPPAAVTVYGKPACVQCRQTETVIEKAGVPFQKVDLTQDLEAFAAVKELGYASAPVVVVRPAGADSDVHWSGFRPDLIATFITEPQKAEAA